jgi:membrane-associated phospholipid phosphatase
MKEIFYDWGGANVWLFHLINHVHTEYLDKAMLFGTYLGDHSHFAVYFALAALAGVASTSRREPDVFRQRAELWLVALAVFSTAYVLDGALLSWLKPLLDFPRPPLALPAGSLYVIGELEFHHSLPSGHSSFAMLIAASVWPALSRWARVIGVTFVLWVGVSRVSLGAHFPADVLAGFLSSLIIVLLARWGIAVLARVAAR